MIENILDHIRKAINESYKQYIKANTIIIDKDLAMTNNLFNSNYPAFIFGLKVQYKEDLAKDFGYNFALVQDNSTEDRIHNLEARMDELIVLKNMLISYIKICGEPEDFNRFLDNNFTYEDIQILLKELRENENI